MAPHAGEKLLAVEMVAGVTFHAVANMWEAGQSLKSGQLPKAPPPHELLGVTFLYAALALVAMFGPEPARLAAGIGGLALLVIFMKSYGALFAAAGAPLPAQAGPQLLPGSGSGAGVGMVQA